MAISPVMEARGGLISPPVRRTDTFWRSSSMSALPLLVMTVTSWAVMNSSRPSAVELVLMKMQSPSST